MRLYWGGTTMTAYTTEFDDIPGTRVFTAQRRERATT